MHSNTISLQLPSNPNFACQQDEGKAMSGKQGSEMETKILPKEYFSLISYFTQLAILALFVFLYALFQLKLG